MSISEVKIVLNDAGIRELLKSPGVQSFLAAKGRAVQAGASAGGGEYSMDVLVGKVRARAVIRTRDEAAREASSERSTLARAGFSCGGQPGRG